ncbi:MAG: DUF2723 domain-containing protein [Bacteroidales bacterium]|nr:DUF2723 domain-containing protein [Bacteroidales bacterium]
MRRHFQQGRGELVAGLTVGAVGTLLYALTAEPSVSWWDCGEFLSTSHLLQIGHPPGAPLYSLLAHLCMLLAGDETAHVAIFSNMLSAVAGGATGMFLCWSIILLVRRAGYGSNGKGQMGTLLAGVVGGLSYVFCDTAWFSAVESEVYALAMLFPAAVLWSALRWAEERNPRWLWLIALLTGMGFCVHMLSLLALPAVAWLVVAEIIRNKQERQVAADGNDDAPNAGAIGKNTRATGKQGLARTLLFALLFFLIGLTPLLVIPIRANAHPPLNEGDPSNLESFVAYMRRDQYTHAPLYPRLWRIRNESEMAYYGSWCANPATPSFKDNAEFFIRYQLGYMYLRYFMWNFSGRYNDRQGFGTLQNGQFITGYPFLDRMLVGTGKRPPNSCQPSGHHVYFMLPLLLGLLGVFSHWARRKDDRGFVLVLFLVSGVGLSLYLNHPCYEPRERDYAYVLSFYAFAAWIGLGAAATDEWLRKRTKGPWRHLAILCMGVPLMMACQNLNNNNRASRRIPRDVAANYLDNCKPNAIIFTYGDNDTFPFWYLQFVEGRRTDVHIINVNLLASDWQQHQTATRLLRERTPFLPLDGEHRPMGDVWSDILRKNAIGDSALLRPVYFSHYLRDRYGLLFEGHLQQVGFAYEYHPYVCDTLDCELMYANITSSQWSDMEGAYVDETSRRFLATYWSGVISLSENLLSHGDTAGAAMALAKTFNDVPPMLLDDLRIPLRAGQLLILTGEKPLGQSLLQQVRTSCREQLDYYSTIRPAWQAYIPYVLLPLREVEHFFVKNTSSTQ